MTERRRVEVVGAPAGGGRSTGARVAARSTHVVGAAGARPASAAGRAGPRRRRAARSRAARRRSPRPAGSASATRSPAGRRGRAPRGLAARRAAPRRSARSSAAGRSRGAQPAPRGIEPGVDAHAAQSSLLPHVSDLDPRRRVRRHPLRARAATGSPRSRSTAPRCATRSARRRSIESPTRSSAPARTATVGVIILTGEGPLAFCSGGDQRVRGDTGYVAGGRAGRPLPRHRPAGPDPPPAQAGRRDGRRATRSAAATSCTSSAT